MTEWTQVHNTASKNGRKHSKLELFKLLRVYPVPTGVIIDVGKSQVSMVNTTELVL
jgi:hypothetical protein